MTKNLIFSTISPPNYTWKVRLIHNVYYMVEKDKQPNLFHRKMQELCFGVKWSRVNDQD